MSENPQGRVITRLSNQPATNSLRQRATPNICRQTLALLSSFKRNLRKQTLLTLAYSYVAVSLVCITAHTPQVFFSIDSYSQNQDVWRNGHFCKNNDCLTSIKMGKLRVAKEKFMFGIFFYPKVTELLWNYRPSVWGIRVSTTKK